MNTYFEILGLEPGASQAEIKKAYFRLIRQHSPESDPEQFQKIREAYERLTSMEHAPEGPVFPAFSEPWAENMLKQIERYRMEGDMVRFRDSCEEAWRLFPKDIQFLYLLIIAQRQCGNTGKAVKNAELLVSKEPENRWFQKELAVSYMERGFTQKAYWACEKAYELGCRDMDFILIYAVECDNYGEFEKGVELLQNVVRQERRWSREEMPELVETYMLLLKMSVCMENQESPEIWQGLCRVLEQYGLYLEEYVEDIARMLLYIWSNRRSSLPKKELVDAVCTQLKKLCHGDLMLEDLTDQVRKEYEYWRIEDDSRIGIILKRGHEACFGLDGVFKKFALTDTMLCMLEERDEILPQVEILREEYPEFYEELRDFFEKLKSGDHVPYMKSSLLKTYRRLSQEFDGSGYYYKKYPQEKSQGEGTLIYDGLSEEPYVRETKKIGRNDPCPCGSGKKYKHCCMRKQQA